VTAILRAVLLHVVYTATPLMFTTHNFAQKTICCEIATLFSASKALTSVKNFSISG